MGEEAKPGVVGKAFQDRGQDPVRGIGVPEPQRLVRLCQGLLNQGLMLGGTGFHGDHAPSL